MIFASLMGPNNMPPIEATVLSCPIIITDIEGHKEQLGDSAMYFNGCDAADLAKKMLTLSGDSVLRETIKVKQRTLAESFSAHNYFLSIEKIIDEFNAYLDCWGAQYKHT